MFFLLETIDLKEYVQYHYLKVFHINFSSTYILNLKDPYQGLQDPISMDLLLEQVCLRDNEVEQV